ncbi:MAG: ABC transporter permease [Chloroflexota bacterium]
MNKILAITWKELYTTFRSRNLLLIMFITPIILSTIMGLAFGGLGGGSSAASFTDLPIAIVNLDEGFSFDDVDTDGDGTPDDAPPSLTDLTVEIGGETINIGEQLLQNPNLDITDANLTAPEGDAFGFGDLVAGILLSEPFTDTFNATDAITTSETSTSTAGFSFNIEDLTCSLMDESGEESEDPFFGLEGTLDDLFDAVALDDPATARAGVDSGKYVAAVIIPAGFSNAMFPLFGEPESGTGVVEVYGNEGNPISASIVQAVTEGIVNQFTRLSIAFEALLNTGANTLVAQLSLDSLDNLDLNSLDLSTLDPSALTTLLQGLDTSAIEPLGCLLVPGAGNINVKQEPLTEVQTQSNFAFILIILGSAQAIFFAMFTGIFGLNSIYEERQHWTLQRMVVSPTPRAYILLGKLLGNVAVVAAQLTILFLSFTIIASLVEGTPLFIWGNNVIGLLLVIIAISIFVSGLGVLLVGLAKTTEQVQFFGPMIASTLGALGGSFGFRLPPEVASFSPIWWGVEALRKLAGNENDIGLALLVLLGGGLVVFAIGALLFKRRLDL